MPADKLAEPVRGRRRTRVYWLVRQVTLHVGGEGAAALVATVSVLLQRLHHDPVQLAAHQLRQLRRFRLALCRNHWQFFYRAETSARALRLLLANDAQRP